MIRNLALSLIVRNVVSGAIIYPANVKGIAIAGIMVTIFGLSCFVKETFLFFC